MADEEDLAPEVREEPEAGGGDAEGTDHTGEGGDLRELVERVLADVAGLREATAARFDSMRDALASLIEAGAVVGDAVGDAAAEDAAEDGGDAETLGALLEDIDLDM